MTSKSHPARFRVNSKFRGEAGVILADQVRSVDRGRLIKHLGRLDDRTLNTLLDTLSKFFTT